MVKIRVKKEFTKKEFLHYLFNDEEKISLSQIFDGTKRKIVAEMERDVSGTISPLMNGNYEVIVEEEVTEDTVIPKLLEIYRYSGNDSINACVFNNECISDERDVESIAFHMVNDDGTTTLLWTKEGGAVE